VRPQASAASLPLWRRSSRVLLSRRVSDGSACALLASRPSNTRKITGMRSTSGQGQGLFGLAGGGEDGGLALEAPQCPGAEAVPAAQQAHLVEGPATSRRDRHKAFGTAQLNTDQQRQRGHGGHGTGRGRTCCRLAHAGDGFGRLGGAGFQLLDTQGQAVPARVFGRVQQGRYLSLLAGEALIELGLSLVEGGQLADQVIQLALKLCLGGSQGIEFTLEGWQPGSVQLLSLQCIQALLVMEKSAADHQPGACAQQGCCPVSGF